MPSDPTNPEPRPASEPSSEPLTTFEAGPTSEPGPPLVPASQPDVTTAPDRPRSRRWLRRLGLATGLSLVLVAVFVAGAGLERIGVLPGHEAPVEPAAATDFGLIREAWDLLHEEYVGAADLDSRELAYAAIDALTEATGDTGHTRFMTPDERAAANENLSGSFVGIGVQVDAEADEVRIIDVFTDSPAQHAGIRRGDVILSVDGRSTKDEPLDEVIDRVRGPEGTEVRLAIGRDGEPKPLDIVVTRARIERPAVSWTMVPGTDVADIRLEQFQSGSADDFEQALRDATAAGATGAVIDLRGNPGGYVDEARAIASQFLRSGVVYQARDARGDVERSEVVAGGTALDLPIVVLVDAASASSSEITAGALQDAGRATVVGVKTFGTGTVLGEFVLSDGSALRIGTVEWLTPDGRRIWHAGITPDEVVELADDAFPLLPREVAELTPDELAKSTDAQLLRALELLGGTAAR